MKIKGSCGNCGRDVLVEQIVETGGKCPWCERPIQADYAVVLVDLLRDAEAAGDTLENALEKIADMEPKLEIDPDSVLGGPRGHLERLRRSSGGGP